jgi:hypothetical protein
MFHCHFSLFILERSSSSFTSLTSLIVVHTFWFFVLHCSSSLILHCFSSFTVPSSSLFLILHSSSYFTAPRPSVFLILHFSSSFTVPLPSVFIILTYSSFLTVPLPLPRQLFFFSASHPLLTYFFTVPRPSLFVLYLVTLFCTYRKKSSRSSASWRFSLYGTALGIQLSFGTVVWCSISILLFSSLT